MVVPAPVVDEQPSCGKPVGVERKDFVRSFVEHQTTQRGAEGSSPEAAGCHCSGNSKIDGQDGVAVLADQFHPGHQIDRDARHHRRDHDHCHLGQIARPPLLLWLIY